GANLYEAITSLRLNRLRSALTAIGVIIGTSGIIVLDAAGSGANKTIEQQIAAWGANTLFIETVKAENSSQRGPAVVLTDEDAAAIFEQVPGIQYVSREITGNIILVAGNTRMKSIFRGVDMSYADIADLKTAEGRFFGEDEVLSGSKVAVLGAAVAAKLFGRNSAIDRTLRMGGLPVRVIGVRTRLGSLLGRDMDNYVYVPVTMARSRLPQEGRVSANQLSTIELKAASGADRSAAKESILALLRDRKNVHGGAQNMFDVFDATRYIELMNTSHATLSSLLAATAAISLIAGGAGVMNIMLVAVIERTHEIGLRRAVGARRRDILAQFLTEAVLLCVVAGIAGLALGMAGAYFVAKASGWPLIVAPRTIALALAAAAGTGIVFGYLPAHRAAALNPIDALRRE
ncbi:MAG TPA: ABC transporter permease, partial [Methylocella sp.]|nr:ABC transporter permease [Methylocella sp.]